MSDIRFNRWLHQSGTGGVSQDSSGHIGIGTTVPTMALDVRGDVNIGNTININNASGIISATTFTGTTGTFSGNVSAVDGTFTGDVTIAGTLTYEDVSNIDAVGIITAQSDIIVGGGLTVTGISTFNNDVKLLDSNKLKFGIGEDLQIYHNGSHSFVENSTGELLIRAKAGENSINCNPDGSVELYHNNSKKFETGSDGVIATGILTATSFSGNLTGNVTGDLTGNIAGISSIAAISSSIADTAYDIFVYDTRKDSDGGAWRKRTQHTSWYNETLNTATRGSRREFPAVAVIVAEDSAITIYDGDDPDLPMWMMFNQGGSYVTSNNLIGTTAASNSAVTCLNGILSLTTSTEAIYLIKFISDKAQRVTNSADREYLGGIGERNSGKGLSANNSTNYIVNANCNDVAMTVLPNAPIDDATGLPIPTIAVGTDGGVSIIKDDMKVVDITNTNSGYNVVSQIKIDEKYVYIGFGVVNSYVGGIGYAVPIPGEDVSLGSIVNATSKSVFRWSLNSTSGSGGQSDYFINPSDLAADDVTGTVLTKRGMSFGTETGMSILLNEERGKNGSVSYVTTSYNTGYMHGDIKGAFLSDTDTTNVTYTTVADDWATAGAWTKQSSISVSSTGSGTSGTLSITGNGTGSNVYFFNPITVEANTDYVVSVTFGAYNANDFFINTTQYSTSNQVLDIHGLSGLTRGGHFNSGSNTTLYIQGYQVSTTATTITNVVVQKVSEKDRSVNNKGLQVFGTVTKSAVATGAELVSYGPFNNSNNFRQPYNSDLNFEQNDFSIMFWVYDTGVNQHCTLISRDEREFDISRLANAYGNKLRIYTRNSSEDLRAPDSASALPQNKWVCVCVVYTGGNTKKVYLDGVLDNTITGTNGEYDIDSTTYGLNIGVRYTGGTKNYSADGIKLALLRISATAPSPEQIKKMYKDEKVLFQENAKATLYGSSDAVTALAYDEDTELLHVGTSAGRSDFQGLRRINNTTTAVTTAISASDELIAEQ